MAQIDPKEPAGSAWCRTCGAAHGGPEHCPGVLKPSGQGQTVWQSRYKTSVGETLFFVTLSSWADRWCARIFSQPNIPWSIPGGGTAIKFLAEDPEECKEEAIRFLTEFCSRKGYTNPEAALSPAGDLENDRPSRVVKNLPLIWGTADPSNPGMSRNVSATGLFVATEIPLEPATTVRIRLALGALSLPLRGRVTWKRSAPDPGRRLEAGMGIQLISPPSIYKGYIQQFI